VAADITPELLGLRVLAAHGPPTGMTMYANVTTIATRYAPDAVVHGLAPGFSADRGGIAAAPEPDGVLGPMSDRTDAYPEEAARVPGSR
jgi:hypothetical protein